ncbi:MAG: hypothetical protein ACR2NP_10420 [Pirellulaceae bacterium]
MTNKKCLARMVVLCSCLNGVCSGQESEFPPLYPDRPCQMAYEHEGFFVNDEGTREATEATTTVRFLQTVDFEDEECWWLEVELRFEAERGLVVVATHSLLIPVSALRFGNAPLQNVKQALFDHSQMTADRAIEISTDGNWNNKPWIARSLIHFDAEPEFESLPSATVKTPAGEFPCNVYRLIERRQTDDDQREVEHVFYLSDETPARLVSWTTRSKEADTDSPGDFEFRFELTDYNENPVPAIPLDDD